MSNLLLNIRFGSWHFQVMRDLPWVRFGHNPHHDVERKSNREWRWFEVYK
jgi:hypothetical protein